MTSLHDGFTEVLFKIGRLSKNQYRLTHAIVVVMFLQWIQIAADGAVEKRNVLADYSLPALS